LVIFMAVSIQMYAKIRRRNKEKMIVDRKWIKLIKFPKHKVSIK
jgi:hypothetical protein